MSDRFSRKEIKHDKFVEEMETAYGVARRNAPAIFGVIAGIKANNGEAYRYPMSPSWIK